MKLVWLGKSGFVLQSGGTTIAIRDTTLDRSHLAEADLVVSLCATADLPLFDKSLRTATRHHRPLDDAGAKEAAVMRVDKATLVIDASGEQRTILQATDRADGDWGRWADRAVIVMAGAGHSIIRSGLKALDRARPSVIAVAVADGEVEEVLVQLSSARGETGLQILDPGLALEA
ncbi:MAG TPA: hypothetical protein VIL84_03675 [Devosiaceae bacterium]